MEVGQMFCKSVTSGDTVELYFFSVPVQCGKSRGKVEKRKREDVQGDFEKRLDNLQRSRLNIRRIVWCNYSKYSKFVTLTYAKTVLDVSKVRRDVTTFIQSMRRKGYEMKYLYILEHQKERGEKEENDGCIHVHMLLFPDKFVKLEDLNSAWKHGQTNIQKLDDVKNVGAYICKYITKDNILDFGSHCYACSIGLERSSQERFYTLGYNDSGSSVIPQDILNSLDVTYSSEFRHDFFKEDGSPGMQTVRYIQGKKTDPLIKFLERLGSVQNEEINIEG